MADHLRRSFGRQLQEIDAKVVQLFALVTENLAAATDTFLAADRQTALEVKARDQLVDDLDADIQALTERALTLESPMATDLRFLLSVLRIVPELERSGDLAEHIASRAAAGLGSQLSPAVRGLVDQMGRIGVTMWRAAADAYADRDGSAAGPLDEVDDELDSLHDRLISQLVEEQVEISTAMEMALVARFYERLGDHALHITERVRYIAGVTS